jgi:hypothetical protein
MKRLWLTYAWVDNQDLEIDHVVAELRRVGIDVRLDRQQIIPGQRLWPQIDGQITDAKQTDGWAIVATRNSLASGPCLEELAYALDRALRTRGGTFPIVGIFPEPIDRALIPSAIATRLYVTLNDPNWAASVRDALTGARSVQIPEPAPFIAEARIAGRDQLIEIRPRSGRWYPCTVLVPTAERSALRLAVVGPSGAPPAAAMTSSSEVGVPGWSGVNLFHAVDNLNSAYVYFDAVPSALAFGGPGADLFVVRPSDLLKKPT